METNWREGDKWGRIKLVLNWVYGWALVMAFLITMGDLLGIAWHRLWNGEWRFYSLNQALAYIGVPPINLRSEIPLSVVVTLAFFMVVGVIDEFGADGRARRAAEREAHQQAEKERREIKANTPLEERTSYRIGRSIRRMLEGWLWPRALNSETSIAIRAGRVFHWAILVVAMPLAAMFVYGLFYLIVWGAAGQDDLILVGLLGILAFGFAVIGRGIRYVLANE